MVEAFETATFALNYRFIEGYLLKEVVDVWSTRHLRYFRIVFSTGKLNIKKCKDVN